MKRNTLRIVGWVMSVLFSAFLIFSSLGKFLDWEGKEEMFEKMGYTVPLLEKIGVVEVALALLFLVPRAGFIAAVLLTAYLGGAVATHVRVADPFYFPIAFGIFMWHAYGFRRPEVFYLAIGAPVPVEASGLLDTTAQS